MVAPALPVIAQDLQASTADVAWILTAYLLAASVLTPILGRLGDLIGKRKVLLIVLVILAAGTLLAAMSTTRPVLIAARALQGAAGAILPLSPLPAGQAGTGPDFRDRIGRQLSHPRSGICPSTKILEK